MATTKKTTTKKTETPVEEVTEEKVETPAVSPDFAAFMEQFNAMKAELEALKSTSATTVVYADTPKPTKSKRMIKFVNLVRGTLVLQGTRIHTIEGQFNSIQVTEAEASIIVGQNNAVINSGNVYIDDKKFVEENDLEDIYRIILSENDLKTIFDKPSNEIIDMYSNTTKEQRNIIVDMIVKRCESGQTVDGNVLLEIGKMCKRNLLEIQPEED